VFVCIAILTLAAVWIDLPGNTLDVAGLKDDIYVHEGLDLQGGLQVLLEANPPEGQSVNSDTLAGTRDTIERRVNELGVSEPLIQTRGDNQIIVELPGLDNVPDCLEDGNVAGCQPEEHESLPDSNGDGTPDCLDDGDSEDCVVEGIGAANAVSVLQETALLEIVDSQGTFLPDGTIIATNLGSRQDVAGATGSGTPVGADGSAVASPVIEPTPTPDPAVTGPIYQTIVSGADIDDAFITTNQTGQYVVGFRLKGAGADAFCEFTSNNVGRPMSIVLDKEVISSPVINSPICGGEGIIEGMSLQEVQDLVVQLKAGALAVPLVVKSSRVVGPSLGEEAIDQSLVAGIVGLTAVAIFMILYYRFPGVLSVIALLIYTALTFALFKIIPVTLTLAGIAGFILSIGMAVDANVLIFARLKEELRTGRSVASAVEAGFDHAWPSIRDSNISTMITCAILYWFGNFTGATIITGFALTLFIGVAVSMFTAITVTRTFLRLFIGAGWISDRWWFGIEHDQPVPAASPAD
jgi:preprotein translocase subunit SecD